MEVTDFSRQAEKQVRVVRCDDSTSVAKINDEQIVDEAATTVEGTDTAFLNEQVENLQSTETHTAVDNGNLPCKNGNTSHGEHDAAVLQQKGETSTVNDHQNIQEPSSDEQVKDTSDDDTGNQVSPSQNSGRHHKKAQEADPETVENQKRFKSSPGKRRHAYQAKRYSNPLMPPGRRTKLPWTPEEEATLKEGMEIFAANGSGNIPWRKILDFGSHYLANIYQEPSEDPEVSSLPSNEKLHFIGKPHTPCPSYLLYLSNLKGGLAEKIAM
ncbi:hypothetical protein ACMD2_25471 [Ananas comosus]|uniref:Myb-like domain-containing protein n=1 Tax=Ananas comosus TaxID=4615 RepID=A0A199VPM3_ANACO|nr:hypothetical protein ACMD2_25471 [Ananas comosus]